VTDLLVAPQSPFPQDDGGALPGAPVRRCPERPARRRPRATPLLSPTLPEPERSTHRARPTRARCDDAGRLAARAAARRRRRILLGSLAAALLTALALPWSGTGGHPLATPGPALAGERVAHHADYVVLRGDTLWSIAQRLDPSGDPRPVVDKLAAQVGGDVVVPGEHLLLP